MKRRRFGGAFSLLERASERQVVVLVLEGTRELLKVVSSAPGPRCPSGCSCLRLCAGRRAGHTAPLTTGRTQHDELADVDLGRVLGLPVLVLPLPVFDPSFDE